MKAGTTWLYENIKNHPELLFSEEKEVHFWANRVGIEDQLSTRNRILKLKDAATGILEGNPAFIAKNLNKLRWYLDFANGDAASIDWYLGLYSDRDNYKYICDFSNLYAQMNKEQWRDIQGNFKDQKVIYTLRDPIGRIWSHYKFHLKWLGTEDDVYEKGFEGFKSLLAKDYFWNNAKYVENYKNLVDSFGRENVKVVYFEDFRTEPQIMLDEICDFLAIGKLNIDKGLGQKKINSTKNFEMPIEWKNYVIELLTNEVALLKESNMWHEGWEV